MILSYYIFDFLVAGCSQNRKSISHYQKSVLFRFFSTYNNSLPKAIISRQAIQNTFQSWDDSSKEPKLLPCRQIWK
jgi:hypothetical protein